MLVRVSVPPLSPRRYTGPASDAAYRCPAPSSPKPDTFGTSSPVSTGGGAAPGPSETIAPLAKRPNR